MLQGQGGVEITVAEGSDGSGDCVELVCEKRRFGVVGCDEIGEGVQSLGDVVQAACDAGCVGFQFREVLVHLLGLSVQHFAFVVDGVCDLVGRFVSHLCVLSYWPRQAPCPPSAGRFLGASQGGASGTTCRDRAASRS